MFRLRPIPMASLATRTSNSLLASLNIIACNTKGVYQLGQTSGNTFDDQKGVETRNQHKYPALKSELVLLFI